MTYENLVKAAKKAIKAVDAKVIKEHLAVEFDIEGKAEGAFYVEFTEKKVELEPYEYYDHDFRVRTDADTAIAILNGEKSPKAAQADGTLRVEGNEYKLGLLEEYLKAEVKEKKPAAKKPAAKKETTAKTTTKTTTKKTTAKKPATK